MVIKTKMILLQKLLHTITESISLNLLQRIIQNIDI